MKYFRTIRNDALLTNFLNFRVSNIFTKRTVAAFSLQTIAMQRKESREIKNRESELWCCLRAATLNVIENDITSTKANDYEEKLCTSLTGIHYSFP